MGLADVFKFVKEVSTFAYRQDEQAVKIINLKKKVAEHDEILKHFTQKEEMLSALNIKNGKDVQHGLFRTLYDDMMYNFNRLDDNEFRISVAHDIRNKAVEKYRHTMERTHLEAGTSEKLILLFSEPVNASVMHILRKYTEEFETIFTTTKQGRKEALKKATDLYYRELCLVYDEKLGPFLRVAQNY